MIQSYKKTAQLGCVYRDLIRASNALWLILIPRSLQNAEIRFKSPLNCLMAWLILQIGFIMDHFRINTVVSYSFFFVLQNIYMVNLEISRISIGNYSN